MRPDIPEWAYTEAKKYAGTDFLNKHVYAIALAIKDERESYTELIGALRAAKELADTMEHMTACRSDDEWVWAAQDKINRALSRAEGE